MSVEYPALMYDDEGPVALLEGHGIPVGTAQDLALGVIGSPLDGSPEWRPARRWDIQEVFLSYTPRIKWCRSYTDGWSCDQEGDWHHHWVEVQPTDAEEFHFTEVRHVPITE